jgi:histidinol-phosphate/aromatic aminotransferase/cobyric acid decarboxylase-like protein/choline kinase
MSASGVPVATHAIILAAGRGKRLGLFTRRLPKPLLPVAGVSLIERSLQSLAAAQVERATIVVGHLAEEVEGRLGAEHAGIALDYIRSQRYASTNDIYSMWLVREHLQGDTLVLQPDVVYDARVLGELARAPSSSNLIAVARHRPQFDGTVVALDAEGHVTHMYYSADQGNAFDYQDMFKTMNIYLFRHSFLQESLVPELERLVVQEGRVEECFEKALARPLHSGDHRFVAVDCTDLPWYEVDTHEDRRVAEHLLIAPHARLNAIVSQYGGFWRHDLTDHCLPSNPHFPPTALLEELRRDLPLLVSQYPVGHDALAMIASSAFDLNPRHLVVANGTSPLIKALVGRQGWRIAVAAPSFNEYENATPSQDLLRFALPADSFELDVEAFARACHVGGVDLAVVINPNNPTSIAVPSDSLRWLATRLAKEGRRLLIDESFVDFCTDPTAVSVESDISALPNLIVLKSVSKVYGVGGLRLGYALTADPLLRKRLCDDLPIWDVNGLAEQFLRLLPCYQSEFEESCQQVRLERDGLSHALRQIAGVHVYPAQANYVFLRLPLTVSARSLTEMLLSRHSLLVKDCGGKSMVDGDRFIRVASRTASENSRLAVAVAEVLQQASTLLCPELVPAIAE